MTDHTGDLIRQARAARDAGDVGAALGFYRAALGATANDTERAHCLRHIGDLARELGRKDEALVALKEAEALYRSRVTDTLALANTVRLLALTEGNTTRWRDARTLYLQAATETGLDLRPAIAECDGFAGS